MPGLSELWRGDAGGHVIALEWSPDGESLSAAAVEGPISLFSRSGTLNHLLPGHGFGTCAVSWNLDCTRLASAGQDGLAKVWDVLSGERRDQIEAGSEWVEHVEWSPDGLYLAAAAGKWLAVWDVGESRLRTYPNAPGTITSIGWHPGSSELASTARGRLAVWSPSASEPIRCFDWKGAMLALAWRPDGRFIATGDQDASVHVWDLKSGTDLMMWGYRTKVRELSWDASGRFLATGGGPSTTVWDCSGDGPEGTDPAVLGEANESMLTALAFHPTETILATADLAGHLRLWRMEGRRGERLGTVRLGEEISSIAWHPSGHTIAAGTTSGAVVSFATLDL